MRKNHFKPKEILLPEDSGCRDCREITRSESASAQSEVKKKELVKLANKNAKHCLEGKVFI